MVIFSSDTSAGLAKWAAFGMSDVGTAGGARCRLGIRRGLFGVDRVAIRDALVRQADAVVGREVFGEIETKGRLDVESTSGAAADDEGEVDEEALDESHTLMVSPVVGKLLCLVRLSSWSCWRCISESPERELNIWEIRWVGLSSAISCAVY